MKRQRAMVAAKIATLEDGQRAASIEAPSQASAAGLAENSDAEPAIESGPERVALLKWQDWRILEVLDASPDALDQREIEALAHVSRGVIQQRLPCLRALGLVYRPFGERSGETITPAGREQLRRHHDRAALLGAK